MLHRLHHQPPVWRRVVLGGKHISLHLRTYQRVRGCFTDFYGVVIDAGAAETEVVSNGNCPTITYANTAGVLE